MAELEVSIEECQHLAQADPKGNDAHAHSSEPPSAHRAEAKRLAFQRHACLALLLAVESLAAELAGALAQERFADAVRLGARLDQLP